MAEENIYYGRGDASMYDDYMDFINYVFGFNGRRDDFKKLLPKLYGPEDNPAGSSYVAVENGRIKAAIGAFDHEICVCGQTLKCRSVGNVAVHPYAASRGFMKTLLHRAVDEMVADGVVLSSLGGRRQRYNYFSYDKTGTSFRFTVNSDNMRHTYGADRTGLAHCTVKLIGKNDDEMLDAVAALIARQDYAPVRPRERLYDILCSWGMQPYALMDGETFAGYFVVRGGEKITEIVLAEPTREDAVKAVISVYDALGKGTLSFMIAPFGGEFVKVLWPLAEGYQQEPNESFSVLSYLPVCRAFFDLKAKYDRLPDGELCLLIHGQGGDEKLHFSVSGGVPLVEVAGAEEVPVAEFGHLEAMGVLFAHMYPGREILPDFARLWFPLPLWLYAADEV